MSAASLPSNHTMQFQHILATAGAGALFASTASAQFVSAVGSTLPQPNGNDVLGAAHSDDAGNIAYYAAPPGVVASLYYGTTATDVNGVNFYTQSQVVSNVTMGSEQYQFVEGLGTDLVVFGDELSGNGTSALYVAADGSNTVVDLRALADAFTSNTCLDPGISFGDAARVVSVGGRTLAIVGEPLAMSENRVFPLPNPGVQCSFLLNGYVADGCVWIFDVTDPANVFVSSRVSAPAIGPYQGSTSGFGSSFDIVLDQAALPAGNPVLYVGAPGFGIDTGIVYGMNIAATATSSTLTNNPALAISAVAPNQFFGSRVEARGLNLLASDAGGQVQVSSLVLQTNALLPAPPNQGSATYEILQPVLPGDVNAHLVERTQNGGSSVTVTILRWNGSAWVAAAGQDFASNSGIVDAGGSFYMVARPYPTEPGIALVSRGFGPSIETLFGNGLDAACDAATQNNSTGFPGQISATGSPRINDAFLNLTASSLPLNTFGYFICSQTPVVLVGAGGSSGTLCVGGSIGRFDMPGQIMSTGSAGAFSLIVDLGALPQPTGTVSAAFGETWYFQAWHRDAVGGSVTSNFTNSMAIFAQ